MRYVLLCCLMALFAAAGPVMAANPLLGSVSVQPLAINPNLLDNASFEQAGPDGVPVGWQWAKRNTDSTCRVVTGVSHSGRSSLELTSSTPFAAQVYGTLWRTNAVSLTPGKPYVLSAWVRSEQPGHSWMGGGSQWQFRVSVPPTGGQWVRISLPFTPGVQDAEFVPRINVDAATPGVWYDDIKLEQGDVPTPLMPVDMKAGEIVMQPEEAVQEIQGDGPFHANFDVFTAAALKVSVVASLDQPASNVQAALDLPAGISRLAVGGSASDLSYDPRTMRVSVQPAAATPGEMGGAVASVCTIRFLSEANLRRRLSDLRIQAKTLISRVDALTRAGQDTAYPLVDATILERFPTYVQQDIDHTEGNRRPFLHRAMGQLDALDAIATHLANTLDAHKEVPFPAVPRWTAQARPVVAGPSFVGDTRTDARGAVTVRRPIFFEGYGHFGQVVDDLDNWHGYGTNIIQIELGPSSIFPKPGVVDKAPIERMRGILEHAQKAGVAVCLLISPHYMPQWVLDAHPEMQKKRDGFLQYCLHDPVGQNILKQFIGLLVPAIRDCPALQSICLSNEPINVEEPCSFAEADWRQWLQQRHGDIATLNTRWGTNYASFEDVPLPDPFKPLAPSPRWMDFIRFNQEFFAGWHKMLADAIHAIAPEIPVHAKAMTWTFFADSDVSYGVDAGLFAGVTDINGNDSACMYNFEPGDFAQNWQGTSMGYDLQRSVKDAPVFNSENHIITDRDTRPVPPADIRAALWQQAIHGQSATAIWVWERTFDPKADAYGSIMERPDCVQAVGDTSLDLNRAALEVTAIQTAPAQVEILHSTTATVWDGGRYGDCMNNLYTALSFTGLKIGFCTERQLEAGAVPAAPMLFVPDATHLSAAAARTLATYQGHLIFVGPDGLLSRDEYDHPLATGIKGASIPYAYPGGTWQGLLTLIRPLLAQVGDEPAVSVVDGAGVAPWGVEWRAASTPAGLVVSLCNYRQIPMTIHLEQQGRPVSAVDVLSGNAVTGAITLQPLEIRLVRLNR